MLYILLALAIIAVYIFLKGRGQNFDFAEVQRQLDSGALLIDVRTASEFNSGHAKGAKNISLQQLQAGTLPSKDKQKTLYLYCRSGSRAAAASSLLKKAGYASVINIGSLTKWQKMSGSLAIK